MPSPHVLLTPSMDRASIEQLQLSRLQLETLHMTEREATGTLTYFHVVNTLALYNTYPVSSVAALMTSSPYTLNP